MEIDIELIDKAVDNLDDVRVYPNYSGRNMYGKECFGIVTNNVTNLCKFFLYLDSDDNFIGEDLADAVREDNLGYDTIYYFPGFTLSGVSRWVEE